MHPAARHVFVFVILLLVQIPDRNSAFLFADVVVAALFHFWPSAAAAPFSAKKTMDLELSPGDYQFRTVCLVRQVLEHRD
jgi:hypothetical protein